jgi:uncharacterized RmlC-like cupin family protein
VYCTLQYTIEDGNVYELCRSRERNSFCLAAKCASSKSNPYAVGGSAMLLADQTTSRNAIHVIRPDQLNAGTLQTPGSQRLSAISAAQGIASALWAGTFLVEPSGKTGIHHHGQQDTVVFVLEGEAIVRWGDRGEHRAMVRAGDFLHVPSWLPHQELNPSSTTAFRWVVVRSTPEPIVVNLPDDFWGE